MNLAKSDIFSAGRTRGQNEHSSPVFKVGKNHIYISETALKKMEATLGGSLTVGVEHGTKPRYFVAVYSERGIGGLISKRGVTVQAARLKSIPDTMNGTYTVGSEITPNGTPAGTRYFEIERIQ